MTYNGGINFGLLADYDAIDDVAGIGEGIEESIAELLEAASRHSRSGRLRGRGGAGSTG